MKIGLMPGGPRDAAALGRLASTVESAGFDSIWLGDHVTFPVPILDPLVALACYAAHTTRLTLGTCVYLLPLRHPTPVAKVVSTLDFISGGRLVFGIGVGGEFPAEFSACEVPRAERGGRANESIEVLRRLWSESPEAFAGRHFEVPAVKLAPAPAQPGGPPIWVGGRADAALRRAARLGDGYVGYLLTPKAFQARITRVRELAVEAGRAPSAVTGALLAFALVDDDRAAAESRATRALGMMYGAGAADAAARYCVLGSVAECRERLAEYSAAGVEHMILSPIAGRGGLEAQLERLPRLLGSG